MQAEDYISMLPLIILAGSALLVLLAVAIKRSHVATLIFTCLGLLASFITLFTLGNFIPRQVGVLLAIDHYSLFFMGLIFCASFVVAILAYNYLNIMDENREEFYIVLLLATLGSAVLTASTHFISFFLGLELLTVSLYVMVGYLRDSKYSLEAATKYLILAASSSAFLLLGMAFIYAELGTMEFQSIGAILARGDIMPNLYILTGTGLMLVGIGFKLAVAPFHMWTPDVYEGAPAPVTAFVATVSKGAMAALLLRYFIAAHGYDYSTMVLALTIISIASMFLGNFLALMQRNVKRILAYSSIAHLGYLLVALLAGGSRAVEAVSLYLVTYFITTLGSFGIISLLTDKNGEKLMIDDYRGLFWKRPWISIAFTGMLLSLAGVPLTAGFIGKFYILRAGVGSTLWGLVIILVINSAIGLFYYIKIIASMFTKPEAEEKTELASLPVIGPLILAVLTVLLLYVGVYPVFVIKLVSKLYGGM